MTKTYQHTSLKMGLSLTLSLCFIIPIATWRPLCQLNWVWVIVFLFARIICSQAIFLLWHRGMAPSFQRSSLTLLFLFPSIYNRVAEEERTTSNLTKIKSALHLSPEKASDYFCERAEKWKPVQHNKYLQKTRRACLNLERIKFEFDQPDFKSSPPLTNVSLSPYNVI